MLFAALFAAIVSFAAVDAGAAKYVVDDVNMRRLQADERPLAVDPELAALALERANDMQRRKYFGHVRPDGTTVIDTLRARTPFSYAGENLAIARSVEVAETALWASFEHRLNILERHYVRVGVAVVRTPEGGACVVQIFAD